MSWGQKGRDNRMTVSVTVRVQNQLGMELIVDYGIRHTSRSRCRCTRLAEQVCDIDSISYHSFEVAQYVT